ncbi:hypothetical protein [Rothia sp. P5766]|uniref:hypothetical protein n=1 Tax=unclassified Rothia (in: high G+C Gram-positive bacteria) TaxID=2689056 RepID=UPI003AD8CABE
MQEIKKTAATDKESGAQKYILFLNISHMEDKGGTTENDFLTAISVGDTATATTVMIPGRYG